MSGKLGGDFDLALCIKRSDDTVRAAENLFDNLMKWSQPKTAKFAADRYSRGESSGNKAAKGQPKGGSSDKGGSFGKGAWGSKSKGDAWNSGGKGAKRSGGDWSEAGDYGHTAKRTHYL